MIEFLRGKLQGRKVLILGFGREGKSSFRYLTNVLPDLDFSIADLNEEIVNDDLLIYFPKEKLFLGHDYLQVINKFDFVIKSPGVNLRSITIEKRVEISSQTSLFVSFYRDQIIGVSGTKGKSTTSSLIHFLLAKNSMKSILIGNIGKPAFDSLHLIDNYTVVVYELSAHQLEYLNESPKTAVLLNVFPEHLDYFSDFEAYKKAKLNIAKYQKKGDDLIVVDWLSEEVHPDSNYLTFGYEKKENTAYLYNDKMILESNEEKFSFDGNSLKILGNHNRLNGLAAVLAVSRLGLEIENAFEFLGQFNGLRHRLELVGEFSGLTFYNDSISTVPQSAIEAIKTLKKVDILILGGFDRGLDYSSLINFIIEIDIKTIIFQGKAGDIIYNSLLEKEYDKNKLFKSVDLNAAFEIVKHRFKYGDLCLLSPAAASYGQYRDFEHRGDIFCELARSLKK